MYRENLTSAELVAVHKAGVAAREARARGPKAQAVSVQDGNLILTLTGGAIAGTTIFVPIENLPVIRDIAAEELPNVRVASGGSVIYWPGADVDYALYGLVERITGFRPVREHLSQTAQARPPEKTAAARENGAKGGTPRKSKDE